MDVVDYLKTKISIHALRGEGDYNLNHIEKPYFISIHALRGEGDNKIDTCNHKTNKFQSTPSVGRATCPRCKKQRSLPISIHALRGEGDVHNFCNPCI